MHAHLSCALIAGLFLTSLPNARAQAVAPAFAHGVHYTFERLVVSRPVNDALDEGEISIVSYVYRPLKNDRREIVLFSHGSTGGWTVSPREPVVPPGTLVRYFIERGFTIVAPMRRGVAESTGHYVEECEFQAGKCTLAENTAQADRALAEATLDSAAVLNRLPPHKVLFTGVSRGGFLSLVLAEAFPSRAKGVVNFVGGWLSISDNWPADLNEQRMSRQTRRLAKVGENIRVPTLWIYGDRDPFYAEAITREFFAAFSAAGGRGEYIFVSDPAMKNGHGVHWWRELWEKTVDKYIDALP